MRSALGNLVQHEFDTVCTLYITCTNTHDVLVANYGNVMITG